MRRDPRASISCDAGSPTGPWGCAATGRIEPAVPSCECALTWQGGSVSAVGWRGAGLGRMDVPAAVLCEEIDRPETAGPGRGVGDAGSMPPAMGIRHKVGLRLSPGSFSPAVCGLWRPTILMPPLLWENLSPDNLRPVLIHELAHVKRADLWVNCLQTTLQIIYFYNPLVWLANAIVRRVREQAVDEMSLVALARRPGATAIRSSTLRRWLSGERIRPWASWAWPNRRSH